MVSAAEKLTLFDQVAMHNITLSNFALQRQSVVITASPIQPEMDMRNAEVFNCTLFTVLFTFTSENPWQMKSQSDCRAAISTLGADS